MQLCCVFMQYILVKYCTAPREKVLACKARVWVLHSCLQAVGVQQHYYTADCSVT